MKLLVRSRELACRNSWGDDLWQAVASSHATTQQPATHRGLTIQASGPDDQVTSVSATSQPISEDTVTHTAIRSDRATPSPRDERTYDHNAGAIADQDERARVMARGSRDAIFSARQRHVQRRSVPRPMIEPDPSSPESDRVIEAIDRGAHTTPAPAKPVSETPPVPRDEVIARGQRLSPASGVDERFDSVPTFNPNVDLPRLRRFFNGTAQPETDQSRPDTSYDLVLQRAQEFKAAASGHQSGVSQRHNMYAPQPPAQASTRSARQAAKPAEPEVLATDENPVVWDVDASSLNVVFERARNAIVGLERDEQPLDPDENDLVVQVESVDRGIHDHASVIPEFELDSWSDEANDDDAIAFEDPNAASYAESESDWIDVAANDEPDRIDASAEVEPEWIEEPAEPVTEPFPLEHRYDEAPPQAQPAKPRVEESPRSSWWRSLNFGRKRRYQPEPEPAGEEHSYAYADNVDEGLDAYGYDDAYADDAFGEPSPVHAAAYDVANDGTDYLDDTDDVWFEDDFAADEQDYAAESTLIRDRYAITSEDSWLEDERYFPEPQPANWYEERTRLLASRPEPEPLPAPVSFGQTRQAPPPEPAPAAKPRRARREPGSYFAIDEPGGMSAFREALFSGDPEIDELEERPATLQRRPLRDPDTTDRLDHVFAGHRDDEPMLMEPPQHRAEARSRAAAPIRFTQHKAMFDETFDIGDTISEDDGEPHAYELASRVSKACWTCRSFRAADEGRRGWCMNEWAPTHRQMVDAEDIACHSSIGDWWIAADTTWIPPVDRIVPETPRTDRLAARSQPEVTHDARESRRVRTRKVV